MKICKLLFKINAVIFSCLLAQHVYAAGYQIFEQNTSDLGRAFAGGAAMAEDASIEFTNPAGMTKIKQREMSVSGVMIAAKARFHSDVSTYRNDSITAPIHTENPLTTNIIPTIHYVQPLNEKLTFGFGITEPFGLSTEYDDQGMARYFATKSNIVTINFNPSLAYAFNDHWSIGAGVSAQYLSAELDASVPNPTTRTPETDSHMKNTATGWGYGVNFGLMYTYDPNTVVGFSYRSEIGQSPSGDFTLKKSTGETDSTVSTNLKLPETYTLSAMHRFNEKWSSSATVSYTYWSRFKYLMLDNSLSQYSTTIDENFHNSVRYSLGADYRWNDKLLLRVGTMYDNSPVDDSNRTAALPDTDRFWLSCGANYAINRDVSLDFGYAHLFLKSGKITQGAAIAPSVTKYLSAHFNDTYVNLLGVQLNWKF